MAIHVATSLLEIERDRLLGSISHLERSVDELKAAIAEEGPDQDYKDAINENVVVVAKYKARVAALEDEIQRVKSGSTALLSAVPVVDEDNMQQAIQQLRQQMGLSASPAQGEQEQQQQQQQQQQQLDHGAAGQQHVANMEVDNGSSATGASSGSDAGAGGRHVAQQQQQQEGNDGVWL